MESSKQEEFCRLAGMCLQRFLEQNGRPGLSGREMEEICGGIWRTAVEEGLPTRLAEGEVGEPGEMTAERINRLLTRVGGLADDLLRTALRQLLKACLQPEFRNCRESYREVVNGRCRRQELGKVRERVSGTHCVDCPYWTLLPSERHREFLEAAWLGDRAEFRSLQAIYLPEDFRELSRFLHGIRSR